MAIRRPTAEHSAGALRAAGLLDRQPQEALDRLTRLACRLTRSPTALISLIDEQAGQQVLKGAWGLGEPWPTRRQPSLPHSFCRHVVAGNAPLVVADASPDSLACAGAAVQGLEVGAYLGVPLRAADGAAIGALCVIDRRPRAWREEDLAALDDLALLAASKLALRSRAAEREVALRDARQSAARYRSIVQDQTELICRFLPDTTRTFVNDAYAHFFGLPKMRLVGTRWIEQVPGEARAAVMARIAALRPGEAETQEHAVVRRDGSKGWHQWTNRALAGPDGGVEEYQSVGHDITGRKRLELELAAAKDMLDGALAGMADGLAFYDAQDRLRLCNARLRELVPLAADLLTPGAAMGEVWREATRRGQFRGVDEAGFDAWREARQRKVWADGAEEIELGDGTWLEVKASRPSAGGTVVLVRDITERKRLTLAHRALHDPLTDLPNRALFRRELAAARARVERSGAGRRLGVLLIDLDGFKRVNDSFGHAAGDRILVETAARLRACIREGDVAARLGGDEFGVIFESDDAAGPKELAARVVARLAAPVRLAEGTVEVGGSVGLAIFPDDPGGPDELVARADRALYAAKSAGRRTWRTLDATIPALGPGVPAAAAD